MSPPSEQARPPGGSNPADDVQHHLDRPQQAQDALDDVLADFAGLTELAEPPPDENPAENPVSEFESLEDERRRLQRRNLPGAPSSPRPSTSRRDARKSRDGPHQRQNSAPLNSDARAGGSGRDKPSSPRSSRADSRIDQEDLPASFYNLDEVAVPEGVENPDEQAIYQQHHNLEEHLRRSQSQRGEAPEGLLLDAADVEKAAEQTWRDPKRAISQAWTTLLIMSYLTFFSILGTLARLGLESLTTYPDAPIAFPTLWVNLGGSLFLGLLAQSSANINNALSKSSLSKQDSSGSDDSEPAQEEAQCDSEEAAGQGGADANDSPPPRKPSLLCIGLSTGFCGSFTTFSSFVRDAFLDLSMNLVSPPPSRGAGDDAMAVLAVIITTVCVCLAAMKAGAHIALLLQPTNWVITGRLHRLFDRIIPIVGAGTWAGAIIMAVLPPDRSSGSATSGSMTQETWRGLVLFAVVFAPVGCIMRFYLSIKLNAFRPSFPLGTFTANILGTAVLGLAWDLQHSARGSTNIHCQVFQGIMDGLCGCLTTVSTWVAELSSLRRRHAYVYGATTLGVSLSLLVIIMGSQKWTTGWVDPVCG